MTQHKLVVEGGELRAIYSDALIPYIRDLRAEFGLPPTSVQIERATHVEPDILHIEGGDWYVDLSPAGGPRCFTDEAGSPFLCRQDAIDFELRWLDANWLEGDHQDVGTITEEERASCDR